MNYKEFLTRREQIEQLPVNEQKDFYKKILRSKFEKTQMRVEASFYYGQLFYQEGNFRRTIEIVEPIVVDYQSYPYTPKLISCFNLMGVATHCETEYSVSRFFYEIALKVARENNARYYYAFEYNNIAIAYIEEHRYEAALKSLEKAEGVLKDCDEKMGAYVYTNKSIALQKLKRYQEALQAYETAVQQYQADQILPDDSIRCATTLYYHLGRMEEYEKYKKQILMEMNDVYAAEFMDACKELFSCGLDSKDDELMTSILQAMDQYVDKYPDEIKVGAAFAELKYRYAVFINDKDAIFAALEAENYYKDRIIEYTKDNRVKTIKQYMKVNSKILELEQDALTGFKNRKSYYKDLSIIERDEEVSRRSVGVVFADVNGLKKINDSLGHEAGDDLIAAVAEKIEEAFPEAQHYRFGGDEFVVLSFDKKKELFDKKIEKLSSEWDDNCSASIGSVWLEHAKDVEKSVAVADEMMYMDKSQYYEKHMHERRVHMHIDTEESLKRIEEVADLLPGGFFVYHADGEEQLITFNQELLNIYKCENEEEFIKLTGNSFKGMVHSEDLKTIESDIASQIKQEKDIDRIQYRILCKDGTVKKVLDYGRFVHTEMYGDVYYVFMNEFV